MPRSVVVIGAGIAGLTAAFRLQQAGFSVQVLEAADTVGGRMREARSGPIVYNTGARLIYPFGRELHNLIDELGLSDAMVPHQDLHAACRGARGQYNIDLMPGLKALRTPGLAWRDRWRLVLSGVALARMRGAHNPDSAFSALRFDDETLSSYIRRTAGDKVLELMVEPVFRGTRSWNPEDISAMFYLSTAPRLLSERTVYTLRGGMGLMTARLAERLLVRRSASVLAVRRSPTGVCTVEYREGNAEKEISADTVVCATQGSRASALIADPTSQEQSLFDAVRYNALGAVHYALSEPLEPVLEFSTRSAVTRLAIWQQNPAADGRPATLYCQLTPEAAAEAMRDGFTDHIDTAIRDEIRQRIPRFDARVLHVANQWIPDMLPLFYPGYGRTATDFLRWQATASRDIYYCGDYLAQALLNGACHSGADVARLINLHWH